MRARIIVVGLAICGGLALLGQTPEVDKAKADSLSQEKNFLNARGDEGVKRMNIGLPDKALDGFGRTMLYEDGIPVLMEYAYQTPLMYSFVGLNVGETEIYRDGEALIMGGNTGYIINMDNRDSFPEFSGLAKLDISDYGKFLGTLYLGDQIGKKGWSYAFDMEGTYDNGQTKIPYGGRLTENYFGRLLLRKKAKKSTFRFVIKGKYGAGFGGYPKALFLYKQDEKAHQYQDIILGEDILQPRDDSFDTYDVITGADKHVTIKDGSSYYSLSGDIQFDHSFDNGWELSSVSRYTHNKGELTITENIEYPKTLSEVALDWGDLLQEQTGLAPEITAQYISYQYADTGEPLPADAYIARSAVTCFDTYTMDQVMLNFKLAKKFDRQDLLIGASHYGQFYHDMDGGSSLYYGEMGIDMRRVDTYLTLPGEASGIPLSNEGMVRQNAQMTFVDGIKSRTAIFVRDRIQVSERLLLNLGLRIENTHFNIDTYETSKILDKGRRILDGRVNNRNNNLDLYFNTAFEYKLSDALDIHGHYARGAERPVITKLMFQNQNTIEDKNSVSMGNFGVNYGKSKWVCSSTLNYIRQDGLFQSITTEDMEISVRDEYSIRTFGWSNSALINPFDGFSFSGSVTFQNPERIGLRIKDESAGVDIDYSGTMPAGISKVIVELNPSYRFYKNRFKLWMTARYYSKRAVTNSNDFFLAADWELYGGINYKVTKKLKVALTGTNLLNTILTQGVLVGRYNAVAGDQLYGRPQAAGLFLRRSFKLTLNYRF